MSFTFLRYLAAAVLALPLLSERPAQGATAAKAVTAQATVVLHVTGMT